MECEDESWGPSVDMVMPLRCPKMSSARSERSKVEDIRNALPKMAPRIRVLVEKHQLHETRQSEDRRIAKNYKVSNGVKYKI